MKDFVEISPEFSVSGALSSGDLKKFKAMGVSTIISNLPDEEVSNGFTSKKARAEADELDMGYIHMPANGATVMDQDVIDQFAAVLNEAKSPVVAHCKTGTRSAILWSMVASKTIRPEKIVDLMDKSGFKLDFLVDDFQEQWVLARENYTEIFVNSAIAQPANIANNSHRNQQAA